MSTSRAARISGKYKTQKSEGVFRKCLKPKLMAQADIWNREDQDFAETFAILWRVSLNPNEATRFLSNVYGSEYRIEEVVDMAGRLRRIGCAMKVMAA